MEPRLAELKERNFDQLEMLPAVTNEEARLGRRRVAVAIWKDQAGPGELKIVVQAYCPFILGVGRIDARGFRIDKSGTISELAEAELFEFR